MGEAQRSIKNRLATAAVTASAAFLLGATVLSHAAGSLSEPRALLARAGIGLLAALVAFPFGLFFRMGIAVFALLLGIAAVIPALWVAADMGPSAASTPRFNANIAPTPRETKVFRNTTHGVSFRYPTTWKEEQPQSPTTLVLLYAQDGSEATANLSVVPQETDSLSDYDQQYFERIFSPKFSAFRFISSEERQKRSCIMDFVSRFDQKLAVLVGELMKSQTSCADPNGTVLSEWSGSTKGGFTCIESAILYRQSA